MINKVREFEFFFFFLFLGLILFALCFSSTPFLTKKKISVLDVHLKYYLCSYAVFLL